MNNNLLKENKVHGDTTFPLATYAVDYSNNNIAIDCHWHNEFEFLIIESGSLDFTIGTEERVIVETGEAIFINSGELHAGYLNTDVKCNFKAVVFSPELLYNGNIYDPVKERYIDPLINREFKLPRIYRPDCNEWEKAILDQLKQIISAGEEKNFGYELFIKGKLFNVFSIIFSNLNTEDLVVKTIKNDINSERLKKVMEYIYNNYNTRISINELAEILNMSEGYFIKFFKAMVRKTPVEYINYFRVNKAVQLLTKSKKIIEISGDVGFENVSYFVTIFKHYMGCTPAEYRKNLLK